MDLSGGSRSSGGPKAGSVWEKRMKQLDEVKGGINGVIAKTGGTATGTTANASQIEKDGKAVDSVSPKFSGKRKTWRSENSERSPLHIARQRSEPSRRDLDHKLKKLSFSAHDEHLFGDSKIKSKPGVPKKIHGEEIVKKYDDKKVVDERVVNGGNEWIPVETHKSESEIDAVFGEKKAIAAPMEVPFDDAETDKNEDTTSPQKQKQDVVKLHLKSSESEDHRVSQQWPTKTKPISSSSQLSEIPSTSSKLQSYADLIMWRDVSKSAFVFGIGTFAIISSAFTNSHNISTISVVSYLGLLYLSTSFLYRSFIIRESAVDEIQEYVVGEEDAIRVAKQVVPFVNEFFLKLKALFSGDPGTTMKLAILLFVLAQFGSSITIWKMVKLGFIAVFTVPKICSSYSSQLTAHGSFWMRRFHDVWESCSHKKMIAFASFAFIWNSMSVVARIWAVFMLFVAFKGYQQQSMDKPSGHCYEINGDKACDEIINTDPDKGGGKENSLMPNHTEKR